MFNIPFIQIPFGYVLEFFYGFFENYGIALILFSLAVKLLLLPASAKSKKTMMKTSRLQPKLKQLEIACGDDKQKYQLEVQKLYKEEGVSMFGGCLWSLLPLLILIPLYNVIREPLQYLMHLSTDEITAIKEIYATATGTAVDKLGYYWQYAAAQNIELYSAGIVEGLQSLNLSFLGIDLGQIPSWKVWTLATWSQIGGALIPLISGGSNLLSALISQKMNNTVITDDKGEKDELAAKTAQTGKTMTYLMPLISVWFGFTLPLGISVYWIAQSVFGIIQEFFLTRHYRKVYDAEDAVRLQLAMERDKEEAERERVRAERRAANPDGQTQNTSKKKLARAEKEKEAAAKAAAAREYNARRGVVEEQTEKEALSGIAERPYCKGRAYDPDRYSGNTEE